LAVKKRVFQVAREFNISNEALIEFLIGFDFDIRNHMSPISDEMLEKIMGKYGVTEEPAVADSTDYEFRKQLKDRQAKGKEASEKTRRDLEQKLRVASELAETKPKIVKRQERPVQPKAPILEAAPEKKEPVEKKKTEVKPVELTAEEKKKVVEPKPKKRKLKIV